MAWDRPPRPPDALREGVREGVLAAIGQSGARTARRLLAAGAAGVIGSVGAVLLLIGHPFDHHPSWHLATFSCTWGALLVVAFALLWLRIRTPEWPLADGARAGIVALGLAGLAAILSPDPHVLHAWHDTEAGRWLAEVGGAFTSTLALGLAIGAALGLASAGLTLRASRRRDGRLALVATAMVAVLLLPGIALQCVDAPAGSFVGWFLGTLLGSGSGIALALLPWQAATRPSGQEPDGTRGED